MVSLYRDLVGAVGCVAKQSYDGFGTDTGTVEDSLVHCILPVLLVV